MDNQTEYLGYTIKQVGINYFIGGNFNHASGVGPFDSLESAKDFIDRKAFTAFLE